MSEEAVIVIQRPKGLFTEEFVLVDQTMKKSIRKWPTPIDATPAGISEDGKSIYAAFDFDGNDYENEVQVPNLLLEISEDGTLKFVPKDDPKIIGSKNSTDIQGYTEIGYRKFQSGKTNYIIRFSYPCT